MTTLLIAAEGGSPVSVQIIPFITAIVVFGVAFAVLKSKVWPRIAQGLDERQGKILDEIRSAEEAREKANAALAEYERSLAEARREADEMIAKARQDAKAAAEDLRRRNEAELSDMKLRANRDIESAKQQAIAEIHAEASMLATTMAGKILDRQITAEDQARLMDETLRELGRVREEQAV